MGTTECQTPPPRILPKVKASSGTECPRITLQVSPVKASGGTERPTPPPRMLPMTQVPQVKASSGNVREIEAYRPSPTKPQLTQVSVMDSLNKEVHDKVLALQLEAEKHFINIKTEWFKVGKILSGIKAILPHGTFQRWIEETWDYELAYQTAYNYKAIYEKFKDHPQSVLLLPQTLLQQMAQSTFPDEILKLVTDNPEAFTKGDVNEYKMAFDKYKTGEIDLTSFENLAKKIIDRGKEYLEGKTLERNSLSGKRVIKVGFRQLKEAIWKVRKYVREIRKYFPPGEDELSRTNEPGKPDEMTELVKKFGGVAAIYDDDLIKDMDDCIEELIKLKADVETHRGLWRQRLVEEDGVTKKAFIPNQISNN